MDRAPDVDAPATTRLGPPGGPDRRLRLGFALVGIGLAVAVLKPWDLVPAAPPGAADEAPSAGQSPGAPETPRPTPWTGIGDQLACFSGAAWTVVLDELDGGRIARSWTRVEPGPAAGPADPAIVRLHAYADAVPRIGFCPPAAAAARSRAAPEVDLWLLEPGEAGSAGFAAVGRRVVAGGSEAAGGMLLAPAGPTTPGSPPPGPTRSGEASWPPGTYVFRVRPSGAGAEDPGAGASWFAVELRGPWPGVDAAPPPRGSPGPGPEPSPGGSPAPGSTAAPAPAG